MKSEPALRPNAFRTIDSGERAYVILGYTQYNHRAVRGTVRWLWAFSGRRSASWCVVDSPIQGSQAGKRARCRAWRCSRGIREKGLRESENERARKKKELSNGEREKARDSRRMRWRGKEGKSERRKIQSLAQSGAALPGLAWPGSASCSTLPGLQRLLLVLFVSFPPPRPRYLPLSPLPYPPPLLCNFQLLFLLSR